MNLYHRIQSRLEASDERIRAEKEAEYDRIREMERRGVFGGDNDLEIFIFGIMLLALIVALFF